jgi:gluconate kinase
MNYRDKNQKWLDEVNFFAERLDQSETGRIIVKSSLIKKYRKMNDDYISTNSDIRSHIIDTMNLLGIAI